MTLARTEFNPRQLVATKMFHERAQAISNLDFCVSAFLRVYSANPNTNNSGKEENPGKHIEVLGLLRLAAKQIIETKLSKWELLNPSIFDSKNRVAVSMQITINKTVTNFKELWYYGDPTIEATAVTFRRLSAEVLMPFYGMKQRMWS